MLLDRVGLVSMSPVPSFFPHIHHTGDKQANKQTKQQTNHNNSWYGSLNDDTKILTETDTETFFTIPNFPKPKPRLFSETKFFRNRNRYFSSETKFSETETETFFRDQIFPKPKPRLFFRDQIFRNRNPQKFGKSLETET